MNKHYRNYLSKTPKIAQSARIAFPKKLILFLESLEINETVFDTLSLNENCHFEIYATIGPNSSSIYKSNDCNSSRYQIGLTENLSYKQARNLSHMRASVPELLVLTLIIDDTGTESIQEVIITKFNLNLDWELSN